MAFERQQPFVAPRGESAGQRLGTRNRQAHGRATDNDGLSQVQAVVRSRARTHHGEPALRIPGDAEHIGRSQAPGRQFSSRCAGPLHALECGAALSATWGERGESGNPVSFAAKLTGFPLRSEEHTSELQSQSNLVCRLLLEKKKTPHQPNLLQSTYHRRTATNLSTT